MKQFFRFLLGLGLIICVVTFLFFKITAYVVGAISFNTDKYNQAVNQAIYYKTVAQGQLFDNAKLQTQLQQCLTRYIIKITPGISPVKK